jgi:glycerophosphoryl diester phosphodiesterase
VICHDPRFHGLEIARARAAELSELPVLENVLSRYRERAFLDIELKVAGREKMTVEMLRKYPPKRGFVISSFLPQVLVTLRDSDEHMPLGLICETRAQLRRYTEIPVEYVIPHYKLATASIVPELREAGKKIVVWTVNDPTRMMRLCGLGVDGIISDDPELLCRTVA